jgi:hypothetical protein
MAWCDVTGIARARNILADQAISAGADLLLFQDSDTFPMAGSGVWQLWESMCSHGAAVVGAAVRKRNDDTLNVTPSGDVGTAYMLIDLAKIASLPRPLFKHVDSADGLTVVCGEDIGFCRLARESGLGVYIDHRLTMGHVGKTTYVSGQSVASLGR